MERYTTSSLSCTVVFALLVAAGSVWGEEQKGVDEALKKLSAKGPGEKRGAFEEAMKKIVDAERKQAANQLGLIGTVVIPLRVFMIPGSEILLGIVAFVIPWRLVPDKWIPFKSLRENPEELVAEQKRKRMKLFRKDRQRVVDKLD